jgi:hypothetical protein
LPLKFCVPLFLFCCTLCVLLNLLYFPFEKKKKKFFFFFFLIFFVYSFGWALSNGDQV